MDTPRTHGWSPCRGKHPSGACDCTCEPACPQCPHCGEHRCWSLYAEATATACRCDDCEDWGSEETGHERAPYFCCEGAPRI